VHGTAVGLARDPAIVTLRITIASFCMTLRTSESLQHFLGRQVSDRVESSSTNANPQPQSFPNAVIYRNSDPGANLQCHSNAIRNRFIKFTCGWRTCNIQKQISIVNEVCGFVALSSTVIDSGSADCVV
jgi:hypothetical protein